MRKTFHQPLSIVAIFLLLSQTFFGSMPVFAQTTSNTQPLLTVTMTENGQPYVEGNVATSPVTIQVQATSPDSAGVQIELSQDLGATWQQFDTITPLVLEDVGDHDVWFKVSDSLGQTVIEKRIIQITGLLSTQITSVTTPASTTIYVNQALPAGGDGKSWTTAYSDLQTALDEATVGNQIWIAKGTYKPTKPYNLTDPRTVSFQMKNDVAIYGGFEGLREETLAERDFKANETILSGDIGIVGNNADNAYHVFYHPQGLNLNATAILDGVTITGGNATIGGNFNGGGGMFNIGSSPTITNVTFFKNESITLGGGIFNTQSNPILTNVIFTENTANGNGGGGIYNGQYSNPILTNVVFNENYATGQSGQGNGGGMNNWLMSNPKLTNVTFYKNKAKNGGGMWNLDNNPIVSNVSFNGNMANVGGAIYNDFNGSPTLTNVTISGNITYGSNKEAIYNINSRSRIEIRNSVIVGNNGTAISGSPAKIEHSLLGDHEIGKLYDGAGIPSVDDYKIEDIFIHPDLANPTSANYRLKAGSPAIDKGVSTYPELAQIMKDLDGNDRIRGLSIDLGAYEFLGFKVSYDGNGSTAGQVPTDSQSYESGNNVTVAGNTDNLEKTGFTFTGWNTQADGSGTSYVENATFLMGTSNVTLYAQWTSNPTYTVSYDKNGAIGGQEPVDTNTYETGKSVAVAGNTGNLEKTGFTFTGWNTQADGSGTSYVENATFLMGSAKVTLYAKWEATYYVLSFESNGGSVVVSISVPYRTMATPPAVPTKAGYTFAGWYKDTALTKAWDFKKDTVTAPTKLYAKWVGNSYSGGYSPDPVRYTLTFESNGGSKVATRSIPHNDKSSEPPAPTKAGYTFAGWYKDAALTKAWDFKKDVLTEHATLYAKWTLNNSTSGITFNDISTNWAKDMIEDIAARGIITGYPDGSFRPNAPIKREHMAVMFARAFELTPKRDAVSFSDVPMSHPYYEAITRLQQAGVIDGSNGEFNPSESLTRAQLAKILVLTFGITSGGTRTFKDVSTTHWSYDYIAALADKGIALGNNGNFKPDEPVTRAQFVAFLYRAMNQ